MKGLHRKNINYGRTKAPYWLSFSADSSGGIGAIFARGSGALTFVRATAATTINASGYIVSVSNNVARSYYDPSTLQYLGYLNEAAATNICLQSQTFNTTWVPSNLTVSADTSDTNSPKNDGTADLQIESTDGGPTVHKISQSITVTNTTAYTFSVWLKAAVRSEVKVQIDASSTVASGLFNLSSGVVTSVTGAAIIKSYPNGWYRCSVTGTTAATTATIIITSKVSGSDYQGNGSKSFYAWGAQLELGTFASSYIVTTNIAVTRNVDSFSLTSIGPIMASGTISATILPIQNAPNQTIGGPYSTSSVTDAAHLYFSNTTIRGLQIYCAGNLEADAALPIGGVANNINFVAGAWAANNAVAFIKSTVGTVDTSVNVPTAFTNIRIGSRAGDTLPFNGVIGNFRIHNKLLPNGVVTKIV